MKINNKKIKAFSLIELSIVILIIGILVGAVVKGQDLYQNIKLTTAQSITNSSPINSITGLSLWLETTRETSVVDAEDNTTEYDAVPVTWRDNRVVRRQDRIDLTAAGDPQYIKSGISGLPSIEFDGTADEFTNTNTTSMPITAGDDSYTFVAVWSPTVVGSGIIAAQGDAVGTNDLIGGIGQAATGTYGFHGGTNNFNQADSTIEAGRSYISIITVNNDDEIVTAATTDNIDIYTNSNTATISGSSNKGTNANDEITLAIGAGEFVVGNTMNGTANHFNGQISEIIVFDKALKDDEISAVNDYLGAKYGINIAN